MNSDFDLPAFLLGKLYDNMDWDDGWTLSERHRCGRGHSQVRRYRLRPAGNL